MLPLVVRAGAGSVRDSMSVMDQLLAGAGDERCDVRDGHRAARLHGRGRCSTTSSTAFAAGDGAAAFEVVDRVIEGGHDPRRFVADLLERLRDLVILAAVPGRRGEGPDRRPRTTQSSGCRPRRPRFGAAELSRAADLVNAGLTEMRGATSPRLQLELICARVLLPAAYGDERSVMARLDRLERGVARRGRCRPRHGVRPRARRPRRTPPGAPADGPQAGVRRGRRQAARAAQGVQQAGPRAGHAAPAAARAATVPVRCAVAEPPAEAPRPVAAPESARRAAGASAAPAPPAPPRPRPAPGPPPRPPAPAGAGGWPPPRRPGRGGSRRALPPRPPVRARRRGRPAAPRPVPGPAPLPVAPDPRCSGRTSWRRSRTAAASPGSC